MNTVSGFFARRCLGSAVLVLAMSSLLAAQTGGYRTPHQMKEWLESQQKKNGKVMHLDVLAESPGKEPVLMVGIGRGELKKNGNPAILVVANPSGHLPIASEGALKLVEMLLAQPERYRDLNWYLVPSLNPDAHRRYFHKPKDLSRCNARPVNSDCDDREGEDPADDINADGLITRMRYEDPEGEWLPLEGDKRLMRRADPAKGERGRYKVCAEGIDNDNDGRLNEDGPGGVDTGINFPHLFPENTAEAGLWPGSEDEVFALIRFASEHREIAMTLVLGETNFCFQPPRGGRRGQADFSKIKIPEHIGSRMGFDTSRTYTMQEIMEEAQKMAPPGMELTEGMVASFLGLGAVVNPLPEDLKTYEALSSDYKAFLKKAGLPVERFDPQKDRDGSFELWSYYHLGLPSFSLDLWSPPKPAPKKKADQEMLTPDRLAAMSDAEFLALGEEKIAAFLEKSGAPKQFPAAMVMKMVKGGQMTTKRMAEMMKQMGGGGQNGADKPDEGDPFETALLKYSDDVLGGRGFVPWVKTVHPRYGEVEVGGFVPYVAQNPPADQIASVLGPHLPWLFELTDSRASLHIHETKVKAEGAGVYRISAWVENRGLWSYPTAMGQRNERTVPAIVSIDGPGIEILSGQKREKIRSVGGHAIKKVEWLVRVSAPATLQLKLISNYAGSDHKTLKLGGEA